ncbi:polymorphic toxin type 15 domain-containing protein [Mitsuaria sp. WAJ17]|uniref:polymorphic toxin type 15 domain-containing protein n=1 Tax=Mitsuaria sp. WAJ17 TaxID=2761452 RepID=UPI0016000EB4|nr:polymorphic toxin type 15 domain-containing protein [Mitsuaria sp. WAJ17]
MSGSAKHAGNADAQWRAVTKQPDLCRVGKDVVGFSSFSQLDNKVTHSPDVYGDGLQIYRVGDLFKNVQADAGSHIVAGTSQGSGHVLILSGHPTIKLNKQPMAWQGSECLINCNAAGMGGAKGELVTVVKPIPRPMLERMGDESGKVLKDKVKGLKESGKTIWEALPWTSDEATTAAARGRIAQGFSDMADGLGALFGANPDFVNAAYMSGDPKNIALANELLANQQQAAGAIVDSIGQSWRESSARSGTAGAMAMVVTSLGTEVVGGKGLGALGRVAGRIAEISKLAKTPLEAAQMLDKEVKAARAAGKSADEIKLLEEARGKKLAEARAAQEARGAGKDAGKGGGGDGGGTAAHIRAKRVPCFHPYDKKKFRRLSPDQKKDYLKEMSEQLKRQQDAINSMTAAEFKAAREAFAKYGRNPMAEGAQEGFRKNFSDTVAESIKKSLQGGGMSYSQAKAEAAARTKELMGKLAALHEPDMVAGGWLAPDPKGMGRADVNSSIGGSWNQKAPGDPTSRVGHMESSANDAIKNGHGSDKMNVQLEVCRGKGLR